jgi:pilus assembly protein CpaB
MRSKPIIMLVLAVVSGGSGLQLARLYVKRQQAPQAVAAAPAAPAVTMGTIVVASSPLRYGDEISARSLREIPWPEGDLPSGAFRTRADVVGAGIRRIALAAIEPNEPILAAKITGEGQRASVSALLDDGMGAVTIQVDEVVGLAGLVLPGDRVDVFATQAAAGGVEGSKSATFNDRILQNVRVLAIGQLADERAEKPSVVRAVTVEVTAAGAQKVALAQRTGVLSLMLRKAGETASLSSRRMAAGEIGEGAAADTGETVSVHVTRGGERTNYAVPRTQVATPLQAPATRQARAPAPNPSPLRVVDAER